jgi:tetratricopeptide (TPR) repeat protein
MASIGAAARVIQRELAVAAARRSGDPLRLAHAVRHLGDAYVHAGQLPQAAGSYAEALAIYRSDPATAPLDLANAIRGFAVLQDEVGAIEDALRLWHEAHDLYRTVNVPAGVAESAARLALLTRRQGDVPRSREWLSEALTAARMAGESETTEYVSEVRAQVER